LKGAKRPMAPEKRNSSISQRLRGSVRARTAATRTKPSSEGSESRWAAARIRVDTGTLGRYAVSVASIGYFQALSLIRRTYAHAPAATRTHVLGRFITCPFLRVRDFLPPRASFLDLGAGHAIFSHLALAGGALSSVALEPDRR